MFQADLYWLVFGRILSVVFSVGTIKIITTFLDQKEVGNYYLINTFIMWFSFALISPVGTYYNRHIHSWRDVGLLKASFKALNKYFLVAAFSVIPVLYLLKSTFDIATSISLFGLVSVVALSTYICSWFQTLCPTLNLLGKRKAFILYTATSQLVGLLAAILIIFIFKPQAVYWHLGILLGQLVAAIFSWRYYKTHFFKLETSTKPEVFFNKELLKFSLPVMVATLLLWGQTQGYRVLVEAQAGAELLGYLGVGLGLAASAAVVIETITTQFLHPDFFMVLKSESHETRRLAWELMWKKSVAFYIPTLLFVASASELWVVLLTSPTYHSVAWLLKWGCLIELLRMMTSTLYLVSHSEKKTSRSILPYLFGAFFILSTLCYCAMRHPEGLLNLTPRILAVGGVITFVITYFSMRSIMKFSLSFGFLVRVLLLSFPMLILLYLDFDFNIYYRGALALLSGLYTLYLVRYYSNQN